MATIFGSPTFLSHLTKSHFSSSSQTPPLPPTPPAQPQSPTPSPGPSTTSSAQQASVSVLVQKQKPTKRSTSTTTVETTDWTASTLTRGFGLGAGLSWAAFLAAGVISEQIKTRLEVSQQEAETRNVEKEEEVVLPNGMSYYELRVGGGDSPRPGHLAVINLKGKAEGIGEVFVDTFGGDKKPLALVMGCRPYSKGVCEGIEYVARSMKAGGKRRVIIPPSLGFGEKRAELGSGVQIPPFAALEYMIEVDKISIAPVSI